MRKILYISIMFILFSGSAPGKNYFFGQQKFVPDGDTIILKSGEVVRYIGIDSPEMNHDKGKPQKFAVKARKLNRKLVKGKKLKIVYGSKKRDRFGRILGYVYLPDGTMVNRKIIESGLAWLYFHKDNSEFNDIFLKAQKKAMRRDSGFWGYISGIGQPVTLNKRSRRFHAMDCKNSGKYKKRFVRVIEAFKKGYSPSRKCIKDIFTYGK